MKRHATPVPGQTYVITYASAPGHRRQATAKFVGLEVDPVIANPDTRNHDKVALHFVLTEHTIRDLATQKVIDMGIAPGTDVHFHLWPEDLINITRAPHATETPHEPQTEPIH
jgi:hypothetical protein